MTPLAAGNARFQIKQNSEINVTPFVDIMLVLVIVFMVAIPAATVSIKVDLPPVTAPRAPTAAPIVVSIRPGGDVFVENTPSSLGGLGGDLVRLVGSRNPGAATAKQRIYVRADRAALYGEFMAVMNALQDAGFYQVALVGEDLS